MFHILSMLEESQRRPSKNSETIFDTCERQNFVDNRNDIKTLSTIVWNSHNFNWLNYLPLDLVDFFFKYSLDWLIPKWFMHRTNWRYIQFFGFIATEINQLLLKNWNFQRNMLINKFERKCLRVILSNVLLVIPIIWYFTQITISNRTSSHRPFESWIT